MTGLLAIGCLAFGPGLAVPAWAEGGNTAGATGGADSLTGPSLCGRRRDLERTTQGHKAGGRA
jgi:hypothetical protein